MQIGITVEELREYLRHRLGMAFPKWVTDKRIKEACRLLILKPKVPASIIGEEVGIYDRSNFNKHFKNKMGCTPAQWRRYSPIKRIMKFTYAELSQYRRYWS